MRRYAGSLAIAGTLLFASTAQAGQAAPPVGAGATDRYRIESSELSPTRNR